ncbi:hypothetical protein E6C50_04410 [Flavobacterium supellecticarium]|uniref:Restriction endonuclease n=1 Tax=Flavobacterium supellecticarium TaxID=2565924 RepID=A0A4S4A4P0_9FLAO|nr:hypothetical protein [Flavobacterium supellecticarium]THF53451.1 hypothetical protein E6C50_04410 [Flavobacterium supellecticarium]
MHIIDPKDINIPNYEDQDLKSTLEWFLSFMSEAHWMNRKKKIEDFLRFKPKSDTAPLSQMQFLSVKDDRIGWYLYLVDSLLNDIVKYEPIQGARIVPIFKRFGIDLELLKRIEGVEDKIKKLLKKEKAQADAILFELLTALIWAKNSWEVKFLPEANTKTPDIFAQKGDDYWYVECKRLSQNSEYSIKEREKWLKMLNTIKSELVFNNILLEVVFHVELNTLSDNFLFEQLSGKLSEMATSSKDISNEIWDVRVSFVNIEAINQHLKNYYVKNGSNQLKYLIGGKKSDTGFSAGIDGKLFSIGENLWVNLYIDSISHAFGVSWKCDASSSIETKARSIWNQVKSATDQFPIGSKAAIHVGLETLDGTEVEQVRFEKIRNSMMSFDIKDKNVKVLYCHFFQSYAPVDQIYVIDETISRFFAETPLRNYPLEHDFLIVPREDVTAQDFHWLREHP